tara:strand:- start:264 stop:452 length:189 start_codon:yes stop_codon:yes gene_type:complete
MYFAQLFMEEETFVTVKVEVRLKLRTIPTTRLTTRRTPTTRRNSWLSGSSVQEFFWEFYLRY